MSRRLSVLAILVVLASPVLFAQATQGIDLAITKTAPGGAVATGVGFAYTLTVTNAVSTATNVVVTDILPTSPAPMTATSVDTTQGSCSGTTTVTCNLGTMNPGASVTIHIFTTAPSAGDYSNTATVTTEPVVFDVNTANNSSTVRITAAVPPPPIPTATEWGLAALAALLAVGALLRMRA
jgi:uncharacterized repeat protein (TIGR01451 family)